MLYQLALFLALASPQTEDPHSYANYSEVSISHLRLDLSVDFEQRQLRGEAVLELERHAPATHLRLDTRDLHIAAVEGRGADGSYAKLPFRVAESDPILGAALAIELGDDMQAVRITYATAPTAAGLQWLSPRQTAGGEHPFLYSQSQPIYARSWIPLQDTPAVRFRYEARVRTPPELQALMSARREDTRQGSGEFVFQMEQPVPSYLLAIAVGKLEFAPLSKRAGVYAEPELLEAAVAEFDDTEQMMGIAEALYGPYRWGRYDLLILPPSFPFGGMENPRLSFITPTVIAGDKSLVGLIAHELAHSWAGNLVTNASWNDLWLNEGFTVYIASRIMEALFGIEREQMEASRMLAELRIQNKALPAYRQKLKLDLAERDPEDAFSLVPYEKGRLLLVYLEHVVGREIFDAFLRDYFQTFAFQSLSTEQFLAYLDEQLLEAFAGRVDVKDVREWIYQPGLPDTLVEPKSEALVRVATRVEQWLAGERELAQLDTGSWTTQEWLYALERLPGELSQERLLELDARFDLSEHQNAEIAHSWLRIAIANDYAPAYPRLAAYLEQIGRRRLVVPLYRELLASPAGQLFATRVYRRARPGYHPLTVSRVDALFAENRVGFE